MVSTTALCGLNKAFFFGTLNSVKTHPIGTLVQIYVSFSIIENIFSESYLLFSRILEIALKHSTALSQNFQFSTE